MAGRSAAPAVHPMVRRGEVAQACVDAWFGRPFAWGKADCVELAAFALRRLGYRPRLPKRGAYRTALAARKALSAAGHDSVEAALDALGLPRIPPAAALPADIIALPGTDGWCAHSIAIGNGRLLGWHEEHDGVVIVEPLPTPAAYLAAWRCDPR